MYLTAFKIILALMLIHIVQTAFMPSFLSVEWIPDLILIFVAAIGFKLGSITAVYSGFLTGIMVDLYASGPLGMASLVYSLLGYSLGLFDEKHFNMHFTIRLTLLGLALILRDLFMRAHFRLTWSMALMDFLTHTIPTLISTLTVGFLILYFYQRKQTQY